MSLHLQRDLENLKKEILLIGGLVEEAINNAIRALKNRDTALAQSVIDKEYIIDEMEVQIEEDCLKTLALHQPVAIDLSAPCFYQNMTRCRICSNLLMNYQDGSRRWFVTRLMHW